jgi:hypothetical protein
MKEIMKNKQQAHNLQVGRIYINAKSDEPMRLVNILPCEGVWMETYDGQGYGHTIKFEDVLYASLDEVQDFLEDLDTYKGDQSPQTQWNFIDNKLQPVPEFIHVNPVRPAREYAYGKEIVRDSDGSAVIGWYDDNDGNDYRCRD